MRFVPFANRLSAAPWTITMAAPIAGAFCYLAALVGLWGVHRFDALGGSNVWACGNAISTAQCQWAFRPFLGVFFGLVVAIRFLANRAMIQATPALMLTLSFLLSAYGSLAARALSNHHGPWTLAWTCAPLFPKPDSIWLIPSLTAAAFLVLKIRPTRMANWLISLDVKHAAGRPSAIRGS